MHYELLDSCTEGNTLNGTIIGNSPINLLVEDPQGKKIGYNSITKQAVNEISGFAEYSGPNTEPQIILIPADKLLVGPYKVTGTGTGSGPYAVKVEVRDDDPTTLVADITIGSGIASAGIPIDLIPPVNFLLATVQLEFQPVESGLVLSWPWWIFDSRLQETESLVAPTWSPVQSVTTPENSIAITNLSAAKKFYRLVVP